MKLLKTPRSSRYIACGLIMNNEIAEAYSLITEYNNDIHNAWIQHFPC